jgi:hypothetical protein
MQIFSKSVAALVVAFLAPLHAQSITPQIGGGIGNGFDGGIGVTGWVLAGSSLDVNFATGQYFGVSGSPSSFLTTSRPATNAYANDASGNWTLFASNIPRITNLGLLVEESRVNSIRNNSMVGAVAGTPGTMPTNWALLNFSGLTQTIVGTGTQNGVNYIDITLVGTVSSSDLVAINFETSTGIAGLTAQAWSQSVFLRMTSTTGITGSQLQIIENTSAGAEVVENDLTVSLTPTFTRFTNLATTHGGATVAAVQPAIKLTWTAGTVVNTTLRIGWPQLEAGASVTSPIITSSAAVTRAADVITFTSPPTFGSSFSAFTQATPQAPAAYGTTQTPIQLDDGENNNRFDIDRGSGNGFEGPGLTVATVAQTPPAQGGLWAIGSSGKAASALASNDWAHAFNSTLSTVTVNSIFTPSRIILCNGNGQHQWNGFIKRIAIWPTTRISNAQLQAITQ